MSYEAKVGMHLGIVGRSILYGCEAWIMNVHERSKIKAVEMRCLWSICGVRRIDIISNKGIRRYGKNIGVGQRMDGVLIWFGHMEKMGKERLVRIMYDSAIRGVRCRCRPRKCWLDGVRQPVNKKGFNIEEAKYACKVGVNDANSVEGIDVLYSDMNRQLSCESCAELGAHPRFNS